MDGSVQTERLIIRPPIEGDRSRFVELFTDVDFTVFSGGVHDLASAHERFDAMLALATLVPFAKQPIIEKSSGTILGYTGAGTVVIDGVDLLEWGWRLAAPARGQGYATEAVAALLAAADTAANGEMLCIIDIDNTPSRRVADKVGFHRTGEMVWPDGVRTDLLVRPIGSGGPPLLAP